MIFKAILSNKAHPELGQATIPLPIRDIEYDHTIGLLEGMDIGSPTAQDCRVDGLDSSYPILDRLVTQTVNVDELDYLAKRLDSFCQSEVENSRPWPPSCACPTSKTSSTSPSAASRQQ